MLTFEDIYFPLDGTDEALRPLLKRLHSSLAGAPLDLVELKNSLIEVLSYLASPQGRTDANCQTVDSFVMRHEVWDRDEDLPDAYNDILADMCGALHDTVSAPHIAENFDSTPEQLLARANNL